MTTGFKKSALDLSAYVLWKLCWIHPFTDGNGRTARGVSYIVLCIALKTQLPGINTIPAQIAANKTPYYEALEKADEALEKNKEFDVSAMSNLLGGLMAKQLVDLHKLASEK